MDSRKTKIRKSDSCAITTVVSVSGMRSQVNYVLRKIIEVFGRNNVVYNFPRYDRRTGYYKAFVNIFLPEGNGEFDDELR